MKHAVVLIVLFCTASLYALTPGYLGKRLYVYYSISGMPMTGAIYSDDNVFDFNFKHKFGIDYVLGKRRVIGASFELINDYLILHSEDGWDPGPQLSVIYGGTIFISQKKFAFDNRGSIAPLGWYRTCALGYSFVNVTDNGKYFASGRTELGGSRTGVFTFGFGKSTVLWDRITFDGGADFGVAFKGALTYYVKDRDAYGMDEITRKSANKVLGSYIVSLHLAIGLLIH